MITSKSLLAFVLLAAPLVAQPPQLVQKWETDKVLKTPESVLVDSTGGVLYVSNIDGKQPWAKDGKGSIAKLGLDGKVIAVEWVSGLEAPKGMGLRDGRLYVADVDRVVVIDVEKAAIAETIAVEGAVNLNDITIDKKGRVFVSDSKAGKVHVIEQGKASLFLTGLKSFNGLLAHGDAFYVLGDQAMFKVADDKSLVKIVDGLEGIADGIVHVQDDEFIISVWQGSVFYVNAAKGEKQLLFESKSRGVCSADLGYHSASRTLYVPTFFSDTVVAYEVK